MTEKEKWVYAILLTPIDCDKKFSKIELKDGIIKTPQLYYSTADEDMSDLSIGFYKILYEDILKDKSKNEDGEILLDRKGHYINEDYMGDTMHSFNSLANAIFSVPSAKQWPPEEEWPPELIDYKIKYHCLANFWVIPMKHGRRGKKLSYYDSVDYYLYKVHKDFFESQSQKEGYFANFSNWDCFLETHCISSYSVKKEDSLLDVYKIEDRDKHLNELARINKAWEDRALEIAKKHGNKLYKYFTEELHLVEEEGFHLENALK